MQEQSMDWMLSRETLPGADKVTEQPGHTGFQTVSPSIVQANVNPFVQQIYSEHPLQVPRQFPHSDFTTPSTADMSSLPGTSVQTTQQMGGSRLVTTNLTSSVNSFSVGMQGGNADAVSATLSSTQGESQPSTANMANSLPMNMTVQATESSMPVASIETSVHESQVVVNANGLENTVSVNQKDGESVLAENMNLNSQEVQQQQQQPEEENEERMQGVKEEQVEQTEQTEQTEQGDMEVEGEEVVVKEEKGEGEGEGEGEKMKEEGEGEGEEPTMEVEEKEKLNQPPKSSNFCYLHPDQLNRENEHNEHVYIDPENGNRWIQCQNEFCGKWRYIPPHIPIPQGLWFCMMNTWDEDIATCSYPQQYRGVIITKKKEVEEPWLPHVEHHFEVWRRAPVDN